MQDFNYLIPSLEYLKHVSLQVLDEHFHGSKTVRVCVSVHTSVFRFVCNVLGNSRSVYIFATLAVEQMRFTLPFVCYCVCFPSITQRSHKPNNNFNQTLTQVWKSQAPTSEDGCLANGWSFSLQSPF